MVVVRVVNDQVAAERVCSEVPWRGGIKALGEGNKGCEQEGWKTAQSPCSRVGQAIKVDVEE